MSAVAFHAREALAWTRGTLLHGSADVRLGGVSIDSRRVGGGDLFVAIVGPRHDAHAFLPDAVASGASGLLVERGRPLPAALPGSVAAIGVEDTTAALGELAAGHRREFSGPVVAITGSNGKTTTKEMCAAILSVSAPCLRNRGNLNNQFGLPLTLLARGEEHRSAVVELGMNRRGEIAALAEIARPDVGVVTNVGSAHIEHLGSRDEIAREKGDLLAALAPAGTAVIPAEDAYAETLAARTRARVVRFGRSAEADVRAARVRQNGDGFRFEIHTGDGRIAAQVAGLGEPAIANALAATAAALAAGANLAQVAEGLARYRPVAGRLQRRDLPDGVVLVDDSYNANPQSMEVALRSLVRSARGGRRIAALGDMGELGEASEKAHRDTGALVALLGIDRLFAVGEQAPVLAEGAREAGMDVDHIHVSRSSEEAATRLCEVLRSGDWVLVKGSRAMRMERIAEAILARKRS